MFKFLSRLGGKRKIVDQLKKDIVVESLGIALSIYEVALSIDKDRKVNQGATAMEVMYLLLHFLDRQTIRKNREKALQAALYDPVAGGVVEAFSRTMAAAKDDHPANRIAEAISDQLYARELEYSKIPLLGEGPTDHNSVLWQVVMRIANDCGFPRDPLFQAAAEGFILESLGKLRFPKKARAMEKLLGLPPN